MRVEEIVTNQIIEYLKQGKIPWTKSWKNGLPKNLISKKEYNGINLLLLSLNEFGSPYYLTFKQATSLKGQIKKGEKGSLVVYWNTVEVEDKDKNGKKVINDIPFLRYYKVFNVEQCSGIETPEPFKNEKKPNCDEVLVLYKDRPEIVGYSRPAYLCKSDKVLMPGMNWFETSNDYYSSLFHELIHSTGNEKRLNWFEDNPEEYIFGSESYSKEELVAELGSAFLTARYGLDGINTKRSAGYIQGWLRALKNDVNLVIRASSKARKAKDYILGIKKGEN